MSDATTINTGAVRFVKELYPRLADDDAAETLFYRLQDDEQAVFQFYDDAAAVFWEVSPAPGGWTVKKSDLRTQRVSRTRGGFHPAAVVATLESLGLPVGARWSPMASSGSTERESCVYLIGTDASPLVKIGRSDDVQRRLADIQRMSPVALRVIWTTPGGAELEARLHRAFAAYRCHGEWFDFGDSNPIETVSKEISK